MCLYILLEYEYNSLDNSDLNLHITNMDIEIENTVDVLDNSKMTNVSSYMNIQYLLGKILLMLQN